MKKLLIISLLSISLPALAQEPQDSSNFDPNKIMDQNFSKPDMNHRLGIDVDSFNVPPKNSGSGSSGPAEPVQPQPEYKIINIKYKLVTKWQRRSDTNYNVYCDGKYITNFTKSGVGRSPQYDYYYGNVCKTKTVKK